MSFEDALTIGVGQLLAANGVGVWDDEFQVTDTAIVFGDLPAAPVSVIGLTPYPVIDQGNTGYFVQGIQVFMRGRTHLTVGDLRDAVRNVLHNRHDYAVGGTVVSRSWRQMATTGSSDGNNYQRLSDSYYFMTGRSVLY